jgi:BirA family transcriptional regulator, biotin operon repressor / biotin---[acetyl-CoA-carboxylase] ligase
MTWRLDVHEQVESTQDLARSLALDGEPERVAVMALQQTRGRGRTGHTWVSPPGRNLALSLILRPNLAPREAPLLGLLTAVAVAEMLDDARVPEPRLKWPNDVLVQNRKIAGILSEGTIMHNRVALVIVGLGLNVNAETNDFPPDLRTSICSMYLATGKKWGLEATGRDFLRHMEALYERVNKEGCGFVVPLWESRWAHGGQVLSRNGLTGVAEGIDSDGALLLRDHDNTLHRVCSGEAEPVPHDRRP